MKLFTGWYSVTVNQFKRLVLCHMKSI